MTVLSTQRPRNCGRTKQVGRYHKVLVLLFPIIIQYYNYYIFQDLDVVSCYLENMEKDVRMKPFPL